MAFDPVINTFSGFPPHSHSGNNCGSAGNYISPGKNTINQRKKLKIYGKGRWRKLKGIALIELPDGFRGKAEIHWYEAHGVGKKEIKIKNFIDE